MRPQKLDSINDELLQILSQTLGVPTQRLGQETSVDTVAEWDSMAHLNIILSIEQRFGLSLSPREAARMRSLSAMRELLQQRGVRI